MLEANLTLCLTHWRGVLLLLIWQTPHKAIHVECIELAVVFLLPGGPSQVLSVGVHQACKAADKNYPNTVLVECLLADEANKTKAAAVRVGSASRTLVNTVAFSSVVADRT